MSEEEQRLTLSDIHEWANNPPPRAWILAMRETGATRTQVLVVFRRNFADMDRELGVRIAQALEASGETHPGLDGLHEAWINAQQRLMRARKRKPSSRTGTRKTNVREPEEAPRELEPEETPPEPEPEEERVEKREQPDVSKLKLPSTVPGPDATSEQWLSFYTTVGNACNPRVLAGAIMAYFRGDSMQCGQETSLVISTALRDKFGFDAKTVEWLEQRIKTHDFNRARKKAQELGGSRNDPGVGF